MGTLALSSKQLHMDLTLLELNELIYCTGAALTKGELVNRKVAQKLYEKLSAELERRCELLDLAENGPEL
jgi:hypothetical protein